jgi:hypothetical protein
VSIATIHVLIPILFLQRYHTTVLNSLLLISFTDKVCHILAYRMEHRKYTAAQIDIIANMHITLLYAYLLGFVLKQGIDSLSSQLLFKDGWSLPGSQLPTLMDPCGVVATLLPPWWNKYSRVRLLHPTLENDCFCKELSDLDFQECYKQSNSHSLSNSSSDKPN